ncbi:MAG TPA: glycosyltransferase family A protein [Pyrinomonadaceae bacterium]|nr:glycosyltransferase family A protein [Pyrinomonadaceae bacterium]
MPTVSVIITTHNRPRMLPRAVASAFAAGRDPEVVVVDDASTDETARVCRGLDGIRYVRLEENQRVAGARNVGILHSRGEYLCFLDDDDVRLEGSLDRQAAALDSAPDAGMVYAQALVDEGGGGKSVYPRRCPEGDIFWELLGRNFIPCGSVLFRRSCLARVGVLDRSTAGVDDWDLWLRIASRYAVLAHGRPVTVWRRSTPTSGQGSSRPAELVELSTRQFRRKWMGLARAASATEFERRRAWRLFSEHAAGQLVFEAARTLGGRQFRQARACLGVALRLHPSGLLRRAAGSFLRRVRDEARPSAERRPHATER